jgi:CubicO group peptidase (beta-lactamase class C family)
MRQFLVGLLAGVLAAGPLAATDAPPRSDADIAKEALRLVDEAAATGAFSGAVLVARGEHVLVRHAVGLADREAGAPNRPETRFNLASVNKAFTRLVVEQLAQQGRLSLDDTVADHVADYPAEKGRRITLRQLVEHRAGTGDLFGAKYQAMDKSRLRELRDWLPLFAEEPLQFEPGGDQRYSNAGYLLLGLVIEKVTGRSYHDAVREMVFAPAGMNDTAAYPSDLQDPRIARGYVDDGSVRRNAATLPWRGSSAGGMYSTVDDLKRFADATRDGRLGARIGGLGISGGAPGINAVLDIMDGYTLVVLANQDPPAANQMAEKIRALLPVPRGERRMRVGGGGGPRSRPARTVLATGGVEVPMLRNRHLPAVHVTIDGQGPYLFAIDTGGAGLARIDAALAGKLGLKKVGEVRAGDPSGLNTKTLPLLALGTIELGGARFEGVEASARDFAELPPGEKVDGILGFGLFADCLLTLDYPGARVRMDQGALPAPNGRDVIAFRSPRGIPSVTLKVAGRELEADLDAGAQGGIMLPEAEAARLPLAGPPAVLGRARTAHNEFEIKAATLDGDASLGSLVLPRPRLEFQPMFQVANVGARVLQELVVTFDQQGGAVRLTPRAGS